MVCSEEGCVADQRPIVATCSLWQLNLSWLWGNYPHGSRAPWGAGGQTLPTIIIIHTTDSLRCGPAVQCIFRILGTDRVRVFSYHPILILISLHSYYRNTTNISQITDQLRPQLPEYKITSFLDGNVLFSSITTYVVENPCSPYEPPDSYLSKLVSPGPTLLGVHHNQINPIT